MAIGMFALSLAGLGMSIASTVKESQAAAAQVTESISDYQEAISQTEAQIAEVAGEEKRKIGIAKGEGVLALKEQGEQTAYEARIAQTQAELTASAVENKLGTSGVRQTGSPLLAAQQQVDLAYAQADRTVETGKAAMTLGGVKLTNAIGDITAMATLTTAEYNRKLASYRRKLGELQGVTGGSSSVIPTAQGTTGDTYAGGVRLSPR